jgi:DNA repair exonuclease SbcCD ATPase subunit
MIRVERIAIQGFRGFLDRRDLPMSAGKRPISVCVFGDNGAGKSSIGDAVEFFFSVDGVLARHGKSRTENNAGIIATRHAQAGEKGVRTEVAFALNDGRGLSRGTSPSGAATTLSDDVRALLLEAPVPLLMRSHEMKTFVADEKGAARYEILSRWVGLERLTALQDALTKMEGKARKWGRPAAKEAQLESLAKLTARAVKDWDTAAIAKWFTAELTKAGIPQKVTKLGDLERIEGEIRSLQKGEEDRSGLDRYETIAEILGRLAASESPITKALASSANRVAAERELEETKEALPTADLRDVWMAARDYLSDGDVAACPVCERKFDSRTRREHVLGQINASLAALATLEVAENQMNTCTSNLKRDARALDLQLSRLEGEMSDCNDEAIKDSLDEVRRLHDYLEPFDSDATAEAWDGKFKSLTRRVARLAAPAIKHCSDEVDRLRARTSIPYVELLATAKQLIAIRDGWNRADREERALIEVSEQFKQVGEAIRAAVRSHVKQVVAALQNDVRAIYGTLRGNDRHIPEVEVVVSEDKKSMHVAISLFGIEGVPPTGYLSDSQLNSLGLALYLAAARRFNAGLRFILLDDIMSSYDASHRLALVQVLAQYLDDFQVIITTHDQAFFREIKAALASTGNWNFIQLKPWLLETGVRFENECDPDDDIDRRLREGEKPEVVAQLIMSNFEDWLADVCFVARASVKLAIRKDRSPAAPTAGNLWSAAQQVFTESHLQHPSFAILSGFSVINWPRHAASAGQLQITLGELQTFWKNFKTFRDDFAKGAQNATP